MDPEDPIQHAICQKQEDEYYDFTYKMSNYENSHKKKEYKCDYQALEERVVGYYSLVVQEFLFVIQKFWK